MKVYICKKCENLIKTDNEKDAFCCGEAMQNLNAQEKDGPVEKHLPIYNVEENKIKVKVGEVEHPMTNEHFIEWIALETKNNIKKVKLSYTDRPYCEFDIDSSDEAVAIYSGCNLHGIWKTKNISNY